MRGSSDRPWPPLDEGADRGPASGAEETVAFLLSLRARGIRDRALLRAMEMVPRDLFAPRRFSDLARADVSLPLPCGQTMTAPATIATMLLALGVEPHHRVLEIGTGSGYVSAVLGHLGNQVVSVERYRTLAMAAAERLASLGLKQVSIVPGDGLAIGRLNGFFDRILLNGSLADAVPGRLTSALQVGGRLVGARLFDGQPHLIRIERSTDGSLSEDRGSLIRLPPLAQGMAAAL